MKYLHLFTWVFSFWTIHGYCQPAIEWVKTIGGSGTDYGLHGIQTLDGGFAIVGFNQSMDGYIQGQHGEQDMSLIKLDGNGSVQWLKSIGGGLDDAGVQIYQHPDSTYSILAAASSIDGDVNCNKGYPDYWIISCSSKGDILSQQCYGGSYIDVPSSFAPTIDGGWILSGCSRSVDMDVYTNLGDFDYWIVKLKANGSIEWEKSLGGSSYDNAFHVEPTMEGGYIVTGECSSSDNMVTGNHGGKDMWVVKLDDTGTIQWEKSIGGGGLDIAYSIQPTPDGGYLMIGESKSLDGDFPPSKGGSDWQVIKMGALGEIQWITSLGGAGFDVGVSAQPTPGGGYIITGYSNSKDSLFNINQGAYDIWVAKIKANGKIEWMKNIGGSQSEYAQMIRPTKDGGYLIVGGTLSSDGDMPVGKGLNDILVVKLKGTSSVNHDPGNLEPITILTPITQGQISLSQAAEGTLFSLTGALIQHYPIATMFDISQYGLGCYLLQVRNPINGEIRTFKIIKQ